MPKSKSSPPSILGACALPAIALCILVFAAGAILVVSIPAQAKNTFGAPSSRLGEFQRFSLSAQLLMQKGTLTKGRDPQAAPRPFRIELGESTSSMSSRLQSEGFITSASAFRDYLLYSGLDTSIQAGEFMLSAALSPVEIAQALQDATPGEVTFGVLAGWRMEEIAAALPTSGLSITADDFLAAARTHPQGYIFVQGMPQNSTFEGFLSPGVYELPRETTAVELVAALASRFADQMKDDLIQGIQDQGLTIYQAVTLASIVEREAVLEDEMPTIASVFLNRLASGMKLDSDPTVQYAAGYNASQKTWWTNPILDTTLASPYNTYLNPSLPPGPISNPGLPALRAVAFPAQTGYYYFRAACDHSGRHIFAVTYEEHIANVCP
jgi:peptidoglycan lytic transglycosylase G